MLTMHQDQERSMSMERQPAPRAKALLEALLRRNQHSLGLTNTAVDALVQRAQLTYWDAGRMIFSPGEETGMVHFLVAGTAKIIAAADGSPMTLCYAKPGRFLSAAAYADVPEAHWFGAVAHQPAIVAILSVDSMQQVIAQLPPNLGIGFGGRRMRSLVRLLYGKCQMLRLPLQERIAAELGLLAQEFGETVGERVMINLPLTHEDLSDLVAATRCSVTRALGELKRMGVVDLVGHRFLLCGAASRSAA